MENSSDNNKKREKTFDCVVYVSLILYTPGFMKMAEALLVMCMRGRGESQMVRLGHYVGREQALCHTLCVVY